MPKFRVYCTWGTIYRGVFHAYTKIFVSIFSVNIMKKKLDSESLGIILLNAFMDEFFPKEESSTPDMFTLVHYNGLPQSNVNGQVSFLFITFYIMYEKINLPKKKALTFSLLCYLFTFKLIKFYL